MRYLVITLSLGAALAACGTTAPPPGSDASRTDSSHVDSADGTDVTNPADTGVMDTGSTGTDVVLSDTRTPRDIVARDATVTATPGQVFCFTSGSCSGATPVCCDASTRGDAGRVFTDTCIAPSAMCGTSGNAGTTFACDDGADCSGSQVCCATTGTSASGTAFLGGTVCAANCAGAMMQQLCGASGECSGGRTCVPMHVSGRDVGYCM